MYGKTRNDRLMTRYSKRAIVVAQIKEKVMGNWLTWYGHVQWKFRRLQPGGILLVYVELRGEDLR